MHLSITPTNNENKQLYDLFREKLKLPEEDAQESVKIVSEVVRDNLCMHVHDLATREYVRIEARSIQDKLQEQQTVITENKIAIIMINAELSKLRESVENLKNNLDDFKVEVREFKADVGVFKNKVHQEFISVRTEIKEFKEEVRQEFIAVRKEIKEFKEEVRLEFVSVRKEMGDIKVSIVELRKEMEVWGERLGKELVKKIGWAGLIQYLAMLASLITIVKFMK